MAYESEGKRIAAQLSGQYGRLLEARLAAPIVLVFERGSWTVPANFIFKFGYAGTGPDSFHAFLEASGFDVTKTRIETGKAGDVLRAPGYEPVNPAEVAARAVAALREKARLDNERAVTMMDHGLVREALHVLEGVRTLVADTPQPMNLLNIAVCHARLGEFAEALETLDDAIERWPDNERLRANYEAIKHDAPSAAADPEPYPAMAPTPMAMRTPAAPAAATVSDESPSPVVPTMPLATPPSVPLSPPVAPPSFSAPPAAMATPPAAPIPISVPAAAPVVAPPIPPVVFTGVPPVAPTAPPVLAIPAAGVAAPASLSWPPPAKPSTMPPPARVVAKPGAKNNTALILGAVAAVAVVGIAIGGWQIMRQWSTAPAVDQTAPPSMSSAPAPAANAIAAPVPTAAPVPAETTPPAPSTPDTGAAAAAARPDDPPPAAAPVASAPRAAANAGRTGAPAADTLTRARRMIDTGQFSEAVTLLTDEQKKRPNDPDIAALLTKARDGTRGSTNNNAAAAKQELEQGTASEKAGENATALQHYQRARRLDPSLTAAQEGVTRLNARVTAEGHDAFVRARQYDALDRTEQAITWYDRAYRSLPDDNPERRTAKERLDLLRSRR